MGRDAVGVRLEVLIPAGAIDLSQAKTAQGTAPQGALTITLTQQHGHAVGMTNELGSFLLLVTDAQGQRVQGIKLKSPMTFTYHYRPKELYQLDLDPARLFLVWPELLTASSSSATGSASTKTTTSAAVIRMQNQPTTSTLTATSTVLASSTIALGVSDSFPIAARSRPAPTLPPSIFPISK